jgi:hypothetical protein
MRGRPGGLRVNNVGNWVLGFAAVVMGLAALFVSARAGHGVGYYGGLAMFLFCMAFVLRLIKASYEHR